MKQADSLIERILFLEGLPNLQKLNALHIGENTEEMLACDMKFQIDYVQLLKKAIAECEKEQDFVSRNLLESILEHEEEHIDWLEAQQHQITQISIQNYLQAQISDD